MSGGFRTGRSIRQEFLASLTGAPNTLDTAVSQTEGGFPALYDCVGW